MGNTEFIKMMKSRNPCISPYFSHNNATRVYGGVKTPLCEYRNLESTGVVSKADYDTLRSYAMLGNPVPLNKMVTAVI